MIPGSTLSDVADEDLHGLRRALAEAKRDDPLAPVTVVTPSGYAAVALRRDLGAGGGDGDDGRRGWANIRCTTVPALVQMLGGPALTRRGQRLAPSAIDLEVIGDRARAAPGWLGEFSSHPSALVELQRAVVELRRCPPATVDAIGRSGGRGTELVDLMVAVRASLHECGLADTADLSDAAWGAAQAGAPAGPGSGAVLTWDLGALTPVESDILRMLGARPGGVPDGDRSDGAGPGGLTEIRSCPDPDEEGRQAVRSVIAAAEAGTPLWRQAVFHPAGPTYARILHQHLAQAGVASNGPEQGRLHRCLTGRILLGLLDLADGDWPRDQVVGWLSAGPVTDGSGRGLVPAGRWDLVSAAAGVVRGPSQWHERLRYLADRRLHDGDDATTLAVFMDELIGRATPPGSSWAALAAWAVGLLDHYLVPDAGDEPWPPSERAAADQVRRVVSSLAELDRVSAGADLASFRRAVRVELERTVPEAPEFSAGGFGDGVFLAPYAGARGLRFHTAVLTGLADALVPGRGGDDGVLSDDIRRLDPSGVLAVRSDRQMAVRRELRSALSAGTVVRVGTFPRGDPRTGRAQVPSRWLPDLVVPASRWRTVSSFAAGLADAEPAVSAREFELRQLDRFLRAGGDPACSPAAADDRLARGFEAARGRIGARFTRFDGLVGPRRVSAFDGGTPVSATRFETYAKCPRRYLFDRVLRVSERVRPEELWRIEPITRGTLVHGILEAYVAERIDGAPRSLERLLAIAGAHLDEAEAGGLVGKPLLWRMDRAAILRDLTRFHSEEGDIEPIAAELSFGGDGDGAGPAVTVVLDDGRKVAFRGSVDRVDRTSSGQLMVSDYKTGRQGQLGDLTRDPVAGGKLLQLPLYAMAARDRFGGPRPVHARYWLLSGERSAPCFHLVVSEAVHARFRQVVGTIADGVEGGCFPGVPGAPANGRFTNCLGCDFDAVCPTTRDRQWGRKYNAPEVRGVVSLANGDIPDGLAGSVVKGFVDPDGDGTP